MTAGPRTSKLDPIATDALPLPQRKRLQAMAKTCASLTIGKRLKDGALILTGIPGWEQGRWATHPETGDRIFTKGYGRSCTWALASDGTLYGHGWGKTLPDAYAAAGASLLPAPTQEERERLARSSAGIRLQGTIRRAAERRARKQSRKPGAAAAQRTADTAALAAQPEASQEGGTEAAA